MKSKPKAKPDPSKDPADFPVPLEEELPEDARYCIECGTTHRPGECPDADTN
jgi:hypothetical protein